MDDEKTTEVMRAKIRPWVVKILTPVWSGVTVFLIIYSMLNQVPLYQLGIEIYYQGLTGLTIGCVLWYFGDRSYFKRKTEKNG